MFTKISVLIPTRHRPERLAALLESYRATSSGASELIFRVDDDDLVTQEFLSGWHTVVGPRHAGYRSMPVFFNEMLSQSVGDVVMIGNDDMIFRTPSWDSLILGEANKYPDGVFILGVKTHNQDHFPFAIVSRRLTDVLGFIWDPRLFWGDVFLRDVMSAFGRCVMLPSVEIAHEWAGWNPDRTFLDGDQQGVMARAPHYWPEVHAPAVREAVEKLRLAS